MASLRTLSIKENPFCEESDDWEGFVMAMLQVRINELKVATLTICLHGLALAGPRLPRVPPG